MDFLQSRAFVHREERRCSAAPLHEVFGEIAALLIPG
uniref:Uncharacterized protein n=1 Tax=Anguilla anguilla TaxID=7936 RepID=A0A0E9SF89_ANGAN